MGNILAVFAAIGIIGLLAQWFSWRVQLPSIFALLIGGLIIGPITGWINPEAIFGSLLIPVIALAVAIILFEGSLTLIAKEIRGLRNLIIRLTTVGLLLTWIMTTIATKMILGFSIYLSVTFAAIVSISGPTVIAPLIKTMRLKTNLKQVLHWESITIDAVGAVLAVLVFSYVVSISTPGTIHFDWIEFIEMVISGLIIGCVIGYGLGCCIQRLWLPKNLHNMATLTMVIACFVAGSFMSESVGLVAVATMGITMANMSTVKVKKILSFKENLSVILISGVFLLLAAKANLNHLKSSILPSVYLFLVLQFIVRPISAFICSIGSKLSWKERLMIAWVFPRGIVGAAMAAIFASELAEINMPRGEELVLYTFLIIIISIIWQSITSPLLAKWLGLVKKNNNEILIIGSCSIASSAAIYLGQSGFEVLMVDHDWRGIRQAKKKRINTLYGKVVELQVDNELELRSFDSILLIPNNPDKIKPLESSLRLRLKTAPIITLPTGRSAIDNQLLDYKIDTGSDLISRFEIDADMTYDQFLERYPEQLPFAIIRPDKSGDQLLCSFADGLKKGDFVLCGARVSP